MMSIKSLLIIVTGIICLTAIVTIADKQNTSKFTRLLCTIHDKDIVANSSCYTRPVSRNKTLLNLHLASKKQINDIMLNIVLYKKFNVVYKQFLVNVKENFCHYFTKKSSVTYTSILMKIAAPYTNLNHSCPYNGDIFINNAPMDATKLRDWWPAGEYRVDLIISVNSLTTPAVVLQIYLEITEKNL